MSGGRRRYRALTPILWALLTVLALMLGASPASAAGHRSSAAPHQSEGAYVVAQEQIGPHLVDLTIQSPVLGRTAKVRLLTPNGWEQRRRSDRWPVFYLLHGCCDTYDSWTRETDVEDLRRLHNVLVVMPEAGPVGWYSNWWNHGAGGPPAWETFHLRELRQLLERGYGAGHRRVVAGLSMGGFGALSYAARNPGMFRAAASYSGVVHPLHDEFPEGLLGLQAEFGEDPLALWGDPVAQRRIWKAHDPYYLAKRLRRTPVFLSVGDGTAGPFDPLAPSMKSRQNLVCRTMRSPSGSRRLGCRCGSTSMGQAPIPGRIGSGSSTARYPCCWLSCEAAARARAWRPPEYGRASAPSLILGTADAAGPSWGREPAVTHGQPRCLTDNRNRSSPAI
jgi:diacylglycerol O-acyltransferase / trehalose O-mycolyltransferase